MELNPQELVERLGFKNPPGQQELFPDYNWLFRNNRFIKNDDKELNQKALIYFWMYAYVPDGVGFEKTPFDIYQTWSNAMYNHFDHISVSGYNPNTMQSSVSIRIPKNKPDKAVVEFKLWEPHVKPLSGDADIYEDFDDRIAQPVKRFSVSEHTCSQYGSYALYVFPNHFVLSKRAYSVLSTVSEFDDLEKAFEYISKKHYYG